MVKQRRAEIIAIERTFPELALPHGRRGHGAIETASLRTRTMSAAASKAVSLRIEKTGPSADRPRRR
ncbi:MAG: hypothetical protein DMF89_10885 [Acidobacteria bacterium]|nr:MAG: hypothetical protein DMF90_26300 [Acidobacteriota bacterium]PYR49901.1 MAG: hypothetical protein DMF89_10885 [Acidobacteriota bacterium]